MPVFKQIRNLGAGFNDIQRRLLLNGQTLTTLGTTSSEYATAAFGSHACTEAVALNPFTLVGLIGALHLNPFQTTISAITKLYPFNG